MNHNSTSDELPLDPWLGRVVAQRYRVVARIGAGGMGVVYRAWDDAVGSYVVIKTPKRELIGDPKFLQRFAQELSALRSLSHPTIVPITDIGTEQGVPFAVMPYLAGGSLKQRRPMFEDGRIAPEEAPALWRWLPAIAQSLDFVHANGYVHRDIKPDNILFNGPGEVYLSDFGVAKLVFQAEDVAATQGLTGTGFALGTPEYMAPELVSGAKASPKVDQYALAVMTYELLAGRKPFDGPTPAAVIIAHATTEARPLTTVQPRVPAAVGMAVARGMAKKPEERFDSCTAFAQAVLAHLPRPAAAEKLQLMCPQCGRLLNVKPDWAGKQGNCPRCKTVLTIAVDLQSLWIPTDKTPTSGEPSQRVVGGQFESTPSRPVHMPRPPVPPSPATHAAAARVEPDDAVTSFTQRLATSVVLQGVVAVAAALLIVAVLLMFGRGAQPTTQPPEIATATRPQPEESPRSPPPQTLREQAVVDAPHPRVVREQPPEEQPPLERETPAAVSEATPPDEPPTAVVLSEPAAPPPDDEDETSESVAVTEPPQEPHPLPAAEPTDGLPVPPASDVDEAIVVIKQAFEEEYKAATQRGRIDQLVTALRDTARSTNDPVRCYALLLEAERLALAAFDLKTALAVVHDRGERYDIDTAEAERAAIAVLAGKRALSRTDVFEDAVGVAREWLAKDSLTVADDAASLAVSVAKAINREQKAAAAKAKKDAKKRRTVAPAQKPLVDADALLAEATAIQKAVRVRQESFAAYREAQALLAQSPDDVAAHGIVARYLCFTKHDWDTGLPHLAKSDLTPLTALANRLLAAHGQDPTSVRDELALAGAWWEAAEDEGSPLVDHEREAILDFAATIYATLLDTLDDPIDRALAEKRGRRAEGKTLSRQPRTTLAGLLESEPVLDGPLENSKRSRGKVTELSARADPSLRRQLLDRYGGTPDSEAAVDAGLKWLASHQMPDGGWSFRLGDCPSCQGQCSNSARQSSDADRCAATSLALLAFYGRGFTHRDGPYQEELKKGITFLAGLAALGGGRCYTKEENMYSQGVAGIALCEGLALSKDTRLKIPAQAAIAFIMDSQDPQGGGWRYSPRQPGDTSASGWQFMALKSADTAGLPVNPATIKRYSAFLDSVQGEDGATYGYMNSGNGANTSAVGLLCRSYLEWKDDHPALAKGIDRLATMDQTSDMYCMYYTTLLLRRCGGQHWRTWNTTVQARLLSSQARDGHAAGSWHDKVSGGYGADSVGRLYTTTLAIMVLESYYRYMSPADIKAVK